VNFLDSKTSYCLDDDNNKPQNNKIKLIGQIKLPPERSFKVIGVLNEKQIELT